MALQNNELSGVVITGSTFNYADVSARSAATVNAASITALQQAFAGLGSTFALAAHTHTGAAVSVTFSSTPMSLQSALNTVSDFIGAGTFTPSSHTHTTLQVFSGTESLDALLNAKAAVGHTHTAASVYDSTNTSLEVKFTTYSLLGHTHSADSVMVGGTSPVTGFLLTNPISASVLPAGTATRFLQQNGDWGTVTYPGFTVTKAMADAALGADTAANLGLILRVATVSAEGLVTAFSTWSQVTQADVNTAIGVSASTRTATEFYCGTGGWRAVNGPYIRSAIGATVTASTRVLTESGSWSYAAVGKSQIDEAIGADQQGNLGKCYTVVYGDSAYEGGWVALTVPGSTVASNYGKLYTVIQSTGGGYEGSWVPADSKVKAALGISSAGSQSLFLAQDGSWRAGGGGGSVDKPTIDAAIGANDSSKAGKMYTPVQIGASSTYEGGWVSVSVAAGSVSYTPPSGYGSTATNVKEALDELYTELTDALEIANDIINGDV